MPRRMIDGTRQTCDDQQQTFSLTRNGTSWTELCAPTTMRMHHTDTCTVQ